MRLAAAPLLLLALGALVAEASRAALRELLADTSLPDGQFWLWWEADMEQAPCYLWNETANDWGNDKAAVISAPSSSYWLSEDTIKEWVEVICDHNHTAAAAAAAFTAAVSEGGASAAAAVASLRTTMYECADHDVAPFNRMWELFTNSEVFRRPDAALPIVSNYIKAASEAGFAACVSAAVVERRSGPPVRALWQRQFTTEEARAEPEL